MPRRRESKDSQAVKAKTLYVRLPHTIKNKDDIEKLLFGNFTIKLYRQSSKNCRVIFSTAEEAIQNLAALQSKQIDDKQVIAHSGLTSTCKTKRTKVKRKIVIPDVKKDIKITQALYISNIKCGVKIQELKEVLPGCTSVTLLKPYKPNLRGAIVKMESIQIAAEYLTKKREWPILHENKLILHADTRRKHKKKNNSRTTDKSSSSESETDDETST